MKIIVKDKLDNLYVIKTYDKRFANKLFENIDFYKTDNFADFYQKIKNQNSNLNKIDILNYQENEIKHLLNFEPEYYGAVYFDLKNKYLLTLFNSWSKYNTIEICSYQTNMWSEAADRINLAKYLIDNNFFYLFEEFKKEKTNKNITDILRPNLFTKIKSFVKKEHYSLKLSDDFNLGVNERNEISFFYRILLSNFFDEEIINKNIFLFNELDNLIHNEDVEFEEQEIMDEIRNIVDILYIEKEKKILEQNISVKNIFNKKINKI